MIYFLDTNIFLRFLIIDDKKAHNECKALFELIEDKKVRATTSSIVFAEIVWVLGSFYNHKRAKSENLFSFGASVVIIYRRTIRNLMLFGI